MDSLYAFLRASAGVPSAPCGGFDRLNHRAVPELVEGPAGILFAQQIVQRFYKSCRFFKTHACNEHSLIQKNFCNV